MDETKSMSREKRADSISHTASIDVELLAEKVYRLMQREMRLAYTRRGKTRTGR
jgi:hypothetical protein